MSLPCFENSFYFIKLKCFTEIESMEKKLIQELEPLSEVSFTPFSKPAFSNSDFFAMHRVLLNCADSFTEYLNQAKEPIRFTGNVVPLKKEFLKFTSLPDSFQSLFGEI